MSLSDCLSTSTYNLIYEMLKLLKRLRPVNFLRYFITS